LYIILGSAVGNADACEVNSASSQKMSHCREESKFKAQPEGDDIGSLHVKKSMQMSVDKEHNEDYQELDPAAGGEDKNMVEEEFEVLSEKSDVREYSSGTEKVGNEAEKLDEEPEQILITPLSEVKSDHKVESLQKTRISPASGEIIGSSTKLLINSVTPRNIGFCDVEGSLQIDVYKEQVDDVQMEASGITKLCSYDY